ncbi:unnamed protein product [Meloidogyne enterolobii]|uniref:Uncharacterized protein n=1 Tax=Meloidogyne enterolobii TaxID=390850 RepID=A0ACB0YC26_MELEN
MENACWRGFSFIGASDVQPGEKRKYTYVVEGGAVLDGFQKIIGQGERGMTIIKNFCSVNNSIGLCSAGMGKIIVVDTRFKGQCLIYYVSLNILNSYGLVPFILKIESKEQCLACSRTLYHLKSKDLSGVGSGRFWTEPNLTEEPEIFRFGLWFVSGYPNIFQETTTLVKRR